MNWQPIETAPKDGESVLLYEGFEPAICSGAFWEDEWHPSRGSSFWKTPTHWMPLPDPPE